MNKQGKLLYMKGWVLEDATHSTVKSVIIRIGSEKFMQLSKVKAETAILDWVKATQKDAQQNLGFVFLPMNGLCIACFALADQIRPDPTRSIRSCQSLQVARH